MTVCCIRCIDLNIDTLKAHFSYNEKLKEGKTFYETVTDIQRILKVLKMKNLTLKGKIVTFKTQ